jgi:hypothetical protein
MVDRVFLLLESKIWRALNRGRGCIAREISFWFEGKLE